MTEFTSTELRMSRFSVPSRSLYDDFMETSRSIEQQQVTNVLLDLRKERRKLVTVVVDQYGSNEVFEDKEQLAVIELAAARAVDFYKQQARHREEAILDWILMYKPEESGQPENDLVTIEA